LPISHVLRETFPVKPRRTQGRIPYVCRCGRPTLEPRKGLCPRCYQHDYHGRRLAEGCEGCGQSDPRTLVRRTLAGVSATVCGNCAAIVGRRPVSLQGLRAELGPQPGDRRTKQRRRAGDRRRSGPGWSGVALVLEDHRQGGRGRRRVDGVLSRT
jgi:hypothetical protein